MLPAKLEHGPVVVDAEPGWIGFWPVVEIVENVRLDIVSMEIEPKPVEIPLGAKPLRAEIGLVITKSYVADGKARNVAS